MDLLRIGNLQFSRTWTASSRVAPVHGVQGTDITLERLCVLWVTRTHMGTKISVAIAPILSLISWTARFRCGLLLHKLGCVSRSSVPRTPLKSNSGRIKRLLGMYLTHWTLSRSRPVRSLIRLKSSTYRYRSVFGVLLGAMSTTPSRSLMEFTWSQGLLVDSKLSSP
jgi:hypothetical protein